MLVDSILAVVISFAISAGLCPILIPFLKRLKFGQQVRTDGPQEHLKKSGTPTMGGIVFLTSIVVTTLIFYLCGGYEDVLSVLFVIVGFGFVGFLDDYLKVVKKHSEGLTPGQKMALQLVISGVYCYYLMTVEGPSHMSIVIPFTDGMTINTGWFFVPFCIFVMIGTDNGVNFCDGLDGLCSSVTAVVAAFFTIVAIVTDSHTAPLSGAVMGSLMGFLVFNCYPAKVFMGDTGSLALGGYVSAIALIMGRPIYIVIVGMIYLVEVLSVIIQVSYFKITHGKRIFKMAPIHHHFELCGWSETKVVTVFTIVTILLCLLAYLAL